MWFRVEGLGISETLLIVGAERFSNYTVFEEAHLGR